MRILLLDKAWPYEYAGSLLKLYGLRQLMYELEPADNLGRSGETF